MRKVGFQANRRLLHVEHISHDPAAGAEAFTAVTESTSINGQHAAGLRFGDRRAQALLAVLLVFRLHPHGFTNADLRNHLTQMLGTDPRSWPAGRGTYDLRRLRLHGLIERIPIPTDIKSLRPACTTPCSSPVSTTDSSAPGKLNLPTLSLQHRRRCAQPPAPTTPHSTNSSAKPVWPHET